MDAVQSLSRSAQVGTGQAGQIPSKPGGRRLLGGVRFWTGLEAVTKAALLLLVGAAIGGLLMPEARAAVAQAEFGEFGKRSSQRGRKRGKPRAAVCTIGTQSFERDLHCFRVSMISWTTRPS